MVLIECAKCKVSYDKRGMTYIHSQKKWVCPNCLSIVKSEEIYANNSGFVKKTSQRLDHHSPPSFLNNFVSMPMPTICNKFCKSMNCNNIVTDPNIEFCNICVYNYINMQKPPQVGFQQFGVPQVGFQQVIPPQVGFQQVIPPQVGFPQVIPPQVGFPQFGVPQVGFPLVQTTYVSSNQMDPTIASGFAKMMQKFQDL